MQFMTLSRRVTEKFSDADFAPLIEEEAEHARGLYAHGFIRQIWHRADIGGACLLGAGQQLRDHIVRRLSEREKTPHLRRCDVGRDTLMHMVAAGEGITLTTEAVSHVPFQGVVFREITDETECAKFSAVWSPHNRSPALKNLLDLATEMSSQR